MHLLYTAQTRTGFTLAGIVVQVGTMCRTRAIAGSRHAAAMTSAAAASSQGPTPSPRPAQPTPGVQPGCEL